MKKNSSPERNYKDVFHAKLVEGAEFSGPEEIPKIHTSRLLPVELIPFDHAKAILKEEPAPNAHQWIHFYIDDYRFERLWNQPERYWDLLRSFEGAISPDFSLYRDMPLVLQKMSVYKSRALAYWMQSNGIELIPNVRWGDERSYPFCFDGIEKSSTVAVGSHGTVQKRIDRNYFARGLSAMIEALSPRTILVYGAIPHEIFDPLSAQGIRILSFQSEISKSRKHRADQRDSTS